MLHIIIFVCYIPHSGYLPGRLLDFPYVNQGYGRNCDRLEENRNHFNRISIFHIIRE